jgi:hypothetical protein
VKEDRRTRPEHWLYTIPLRLRSLSRGRRRTRNQFFFDVAILCNIRPHLEGIGSADRLLQMLPCCRIVVVDFPADVEFLRSHSERL